MAGPRDRLREALRLHGWSRYEGGEYQRGRCRVKLGDDLESFVSDGEGGSFLSTSEAVEWVAQRTWPADGAPAIRARAEFAWSPEDGEPITYLVELYANDAADITPRGNPGRGIMALVWDPDVEELQGGTDNGRLSPAEQHRVRAKATSALREIMGAVRI
jgi:hypothetical protein